MEMPKTIGILALLIDIWTFGISIRGILIRSRGFVVKN